MDRTMLARATEGTDAPTPGYLYVDLQKQAAGNPVACQEMAAYLTRRLASKQSPNIKFKCCKVIQKLAEGVPHFRRCVAQNPSAVSSIKEAGMFRGVMDPVRGDVPNQKVRSAAKEALEAVYREAPSSEQAAAASYGGGGGISASYGPSPHGGGGGGGGYGAPGAVSGSRMQGVGNPMYQDPRLAQAQQPSNFKEAVREAGGVIATMIKDPLARNVHIQPPSHHHHPQQQHVPRQGHSGDLPGYNRSAQYGRPPPGSAELSRQTGGQWTMASNRGPGAVQPNGTGPTVNGSGADSSYYKERDTSFQWTKQQGQHSSAAGGAVGGSWGAAATAAPPPPHAGIVRSGGPVSTPVVTNMPSSGGRAVSDGSYERNLIKELCPPGGMKAVPPPDKLASFRSAVPSLHSDLICPVLLDCLEEGQPWIIRAKALCVMETCLEAGAKPDGTNPYRDFFHACHEEIMPLSVHPRTAISAPARRVLALLGVEGSGAAAAAGSHHHQAPPITAPPPNLLDFDDEEPPAAPAPAPAAPPAPAPPAAAPAPAAAPGAGTMFGGMQVKAATPNGVAAAAAAPEVVPAATSGDLLGVDFGATPAAAAAAPPPPPPAASPPAAAPPAAAPAAATTTTTTTNSMFAQMNLKDNGNAAAAATSTEPAAPAAAPPAAATTAELNKSTDSAASAGGELAVLANGGSAFGFINQDAASAGGATAASTPAPASTPGAPPAPESFDPLKNLTPNTAQRKMMQLSPEQMQAMAYQQNMWNMQQQQQMLAAMAALQQQKAGGGMPGAMPVGMPMMMPFAVPQGMVGAAGGTGPGAAAAAAQQQQQKKFSFVAPAKKDDKKFDFVKDEMSTAGHKK